MFELVWFGVDKKVKIPFTETSIYTWHDEDRRKFVLTVEDKQCCEARRPLEHKLQKNGRGV